MGFFTNYFSGKPGQGDFSAGKLPKNRVELFFTVMKDHWAQLIGLNMLYFIVWIPLFVWMLVHFLYLMQTLNESTLPWAEYMAQFRLFFLGAAPLIAITGPVTAGISFVMRNWARDEHVFVFSDMWDAIRQNWKQALAVSALTGLFPLVTFTAYYVYSLLVSTWSVVAVMPIVFVCIGQILWLFMLEPMYTLMVTYDLRFRDLLKNALFLALSNLPRTVGIRLAAFALPLVAILVCASNFSLLIYVLFAIFAYYLLFGLSISRLLYASYGNMLCEKYLNPHIEGAESNIGLRPEDDTVYRDEDDE